MKIRFDAPPGAGQDPSGLAVRYAAAKRQVPRWRWYLLLALVMAAPLYLAARFLGGVLFAQVPASVVLEQSVVRVPQAGLIEYVAAQGQALAAGAPVLRMRESPVSAPASQRPSMPLPVGQARDRMLREAVALAERQWRLRRERLARIEALQAQGAATRPEVEAARVQALQAQADLNRARGELAEHREALAAQGQAAVAAPAQAALVAAVVPAAFDAQVARVYVHAGEWHPAGAEAVLLQSAGPPQVQAYLDPAEARRAQPGRRVTLRFADGHRAAAEVAEIVPHVERLPADRVSPLSPRTASVLVMLRPLEPLPARYRIHGLPLDVQFGLW